MKHLLKSLSTSTVTLSILSTLTIASAGAVTLPDGRVAFNRPPNLVEATTLTAGSSERGRYHFVVEVPADAGEPLGAVVITPRDRAERVNFQLNATTAHQGEAYANGPALTLANVGGAPDNPEDVLVVFDQPVQPGETVTIILETEQNPFGGVYLYGVTGYPAGENSVGQFLGYGRINIFDAGN